MSKAYLFAIMLLTGGIIGCLEASEQDDELIEVLGVDEAYVTASKFLVDKFTDALYGAICEKLMYDATDSYKDGENNAAMAAPDWEYMEFENTGKQAALTGDIYGVTGPGIFCNKHDGCDGAKISQFYMAENSDTGDWGYAAEGFRTTDGDYLEVVNTL